MKTPAAQTRLQQLLTAFRQKHENDAGEAMSGQCDAFALALKQHLDTHAPYAGLSVTLGVVERERIGLDSNQVLDYNKLSHAVVEIGQDQQADAWGLDAMQRWEDDWIQPEEDDEVEACEDVFTLRTISELELRALRKNQDRREINATFARRVGRALKQAEATLSVAVAPAGPKPAQTRRKVRR
jgi:hypothetical protein